MTPPSRPSGPGDPVLVPLPASPPLAGPEADQDADSAGRPQSGTGSAAAGMGPRTATGGGLVAVLDPTRGLRGLWRGHEAVAGILRLSAGRRPLRPAPDLRTAPGGWDRSVPLPEGGLLEERGLLPEVGGALVLQWTARPPASGPRGEAPLQLTVELDPPGGRPALKARLSLPPGEPVAVAVAPPGGDPEAARRLLSPLPARERERAGRGRTPGRPPFLIREERDTGLARTRFLPLALRALDDAPLGVDANGSPGPPFLAGVEDGAPRFLEGTALAEVGLAAVLAGRADLGRAILLHLAEAGGSVPPLPLLLLAARWALWTGRPDGLPVSREALDREADRGLEQPGSPAAFPSLARTLELLADAMEPLGRGEWTEGLRRRARMAREGTGQGRVPGRMVLPVVGGGATEAADDRGDDPVLPAPGAFGSPDEPGFLPNRTLQGARLIRSWVEGSLGAQADAAYGRLTLGPAFPGGWQRVAMVGLRVGDASVSLDCRREKGACTFVLRQDGGRVPLNLVFRPRVPFRKVDEVLVEGRGADVEIVEEEAGLEVRCQFPLDPERRMTVVGSA